MRYEVPVYLRRHHDGRASAQVLDPAPGREGPLVAHAASTEEALAAIAEVVARRFTDPDDELCERLLEEATLELRRVRVGVRVRRASGRRAEVVLPVTAALVKRADGGATAIVPRLGAVFDVAQAAEAAASIEDEVRSALAGADDEAALDALLPDLEESFETLAVEAPPRARTLARKRRRRPDDEEGGVLTEVGTDLTAEARRGTGAKAYERDALVEQVLAALRADPPASVLLVGPSGTGKSAIVAEAARRIGLGEAGDALRLARLRVVHISGNRVIAGMSYLGDWEERAKEIAEEARERRAVLYVDDLAELCEAGRPPGGPGGGVAGFLAPSVARRELTLIAEATPERLRRVERLEPGLLPLFRRLEVPELPRDPTLAVLGKLAGPLGRAHDVAVAPEALEASVDATIRFQPGRRLPGKAVELLRRAVEAEAERRREARRRAAAQGPAALTRAPSSPAGDAPAPSPSPPPPAATPAPSPRGGPPLGKREVLAAFARLSGLPEEVLRDDLPIAREALVADFEAKVVEQPAAARALADALLLAKAGLASPGKPVAVYLFAGPTGVGKTESAKSLAARLFGDPARLARFDMSEFQDAAGALRLAGGEGIGEGELARRVREQPFAVLLLDEIEKAHESVFDLLLSVLGEGRLVDHGGRVADFRSAIVILTSNLGADSRDGLGFDVRRGPSADAVAERYRAAAAAFFRPELLNRIDRVVAFRPLSPAAIERIAARELADVLRREGLERRRIAVLAAPDLVPALARAGFHPRHGARPLRREVERRVLAPLARWLVRRPGRSDARILLSLDPEEGAPEARLAARETVPRPVRGGEFFDAPGAGEPPAGPGRLREGIGAVRARLEDLLDAAALEAAPALRGTRSGREPGTARGALDALARLEATLDRAAPLEGEALRSLGARLAALDLEATRMEVAALAADLRLAPLERIEVREEIAGARAGAAEEAVLAGMEGWVGGGGAGEGGGVRGRGAGQGGREGRVIVFADPRRAAALAVEAGVHEFALDAPDEGTRGARVRVEVPGAATEARVVRRYGSDPVPGASDPRTGLFQRGAAPLAPQVLERYILAALRRRAAGAS